MPPGSILRRLVPVSAAAACLISAQNPLASAAHGCAHSCGGGHASFSHASFSHPSFSHSSFSHSSFSSSFPHSSFSHSFSSFYSHSSYSTPSYVRSSGSTYCAPSAFTHLFFNHGSTHLQTTPLPPLSTQPVYAPPAHCGILGHLHRFFTGQHNVVITPPVQPVQVLPAPPPVVPTSMVIVESTPTGCSSTSSWPTNLFMLGSIITWLLPAQPPMRVIEENDPNANAIVESSPPDDQSPKMLETPWPDGATPIDGSAEVAADALLPPATEQDGGSDPDSMPVTSAAQNSNTATYSTPFKPVSYLLPSADGVLSIYFAHEHPLTENYVQEHASFLWLALMHLH